MARAVERAPRMIEIDAFERGGEAVGIAFAPDLAVGDDVEAGPLLRPDRKSTRLNSSHSSISYAVFCLKKKKKKKRKQQKYKQNTVKFNVFKSVTKSYIN